jgi:hypothetical protein
LISLEEFIRTHKRDEGLFQDNVAEINYDK